VGGIVAFRQPVIPAGIRRYVNKAPCPALGLPFRQTTAMAAQLIRECQPPAGVKVTVLFDADYWCRTVVKACREQGFPCASTLKSHRRLGQQGWPLNAGRSGRNLVRRRRTTPLVLAKPHGQTRYRCVAAGWLEVSHLGPLHRVCSRQGTARNILGLVTDDSALPAAGLIRTSETRGAVEPCFQDSQPLWGLGHYQNRPSWAAVTHLHLMCCAYALLTHLRIERDGAQGQRPRKKAAELSTAAAQDQLRGLLWEDLLTYLREKPHGQPLIEELERLRVASPETRQST
jgi:hypothetical protein